jgi:hypothetical protein
MIWENQFRYLLCIKYHGIKFNLYNKYLTNILSTCWEYDIQTEKIISGISQQNGVVECKNRTINELSRSMRLHVVLPLIFWLEAVNNLIN